MGLDGWVGVGVAGEELESKSSMGVVELELEGKRRKGVGG